MKKTLSVIFVVLFALALLVLAGYGFWQYRNQKVEKIVVHINRTGKNGFLDAKVLRKGILHRQKIIGKPVKSVHPKEIEKFLTQNPYVKAVDVYFNLSGNLMVNITERTALIRVFNRQNQSCYVDTDGILFPLGTSYAPRVLPVNGYIDVRWKPGENIFSKKYRHTLLPALFLLAKKIGANDFLKADISQLFVNSKGKIDMVPELGRYVIHFGDSSQMNVKLENLEAFCKQVFAQGGWSKYNRINLEYTNQVICTKK